jgi:hypothetical protein
VTSLSTDVFTGRQNVFVQPSRAAERIIMFFASLVRFLLIVLAGVYVWKALKRAIWGGTRTSTTPPSRTQRSSERFEDAEDIDFEDIE